MTLKWVGARPLVPALQSKPPATECQGLIPQKRLCLPRSLDLTGPLLLGGVPNLPEDFPVHSRQFVGCMRNLSIDGRIVDMAAFIANNGTRAGKHIPWCIGLAWCPLDICGHSRDRRALSTSQRVLDRYLPEGKGLVEWIESLAWWAWPEPTVR